MIGYDYNCLEDVFIDNCIPLSEGDTIVQLRISQGKVPHYFVGFGPNSYRGFCYISTEEPLYISTRDDMMTNDYRQDLIEAINKNWNNLKNDKKWSFILPVTKPDYSKLKTQKYWQNNKKIFKPNNTCNSFEICNNNKYPDLSLKISLVSDNDIPYFYIESYNDSNDCGYIDAINYYYLTNNRLSEMTEYTCNQLIAANWDNLLQIDNRLLDFCPVAFMSSLRERS